MTAARGIIHSEMPQQTEGRMRGFQLWLNLPSREKMKPAAYREIPPSEIPTVELDGGGEASVIAGALQQSAGRVSGPIGGLSTEPVYLDVRLPPGVDATIPVPATHNAFMYVYEGDAMVGEDDRPLPFRAAGLLTSGDAVRIRAGGKGVKLLLLAGRPIGEPVVQYGPFVMTTSREIEQAIVDYQRGTLAAAG
jgi:redox-sensitive bicupin YhaK (pirin superfamily)